MYITICQLTSHSLKPIHLAASQHAGESRFLTTASNHLPIAQPKKMRTPQHSAFLQRWHNMLNLPRQTAPSWHRDRLREELQERRLAKTAWRKLSETSDVFFCISRAQHDGFPVHVLPRFKPLRHGLVYAYMLAKYTLRWGFNRVVAGLCRGVPPGGRVREVVNPGKDGKLEEVAASHRIDLGEFGRVGRRLRWVWPLLP